MFVIRAVLIFLIAFLVAVPLYAVPATITLPPGPRPGLEELTIQQAAIQLRKSGKTNWELVEAARSASGQTDRMAYLG